MDLLDMHDNTVYCSEVHLFYTFHYIDICLFLLLFYYNNNASDSTQGYRKFHKAPQVERTDLAAWWRQVISPCVSVFLFY